MADQVGSVTDFYDRLAAEYHLIYADWEGAIARQSAVLDRIVRSNLSGWPLSLLDCACGIGTQAIGMAQRGYRVRATDISARSVERLIVEAEQRGAALKAAVADMRTLPEQIGERFDVVICCDNAMPHLVSDRDLQSAAASMWNVLKDGGLALISIRDYDQAVIDRPRLEGPRILEGRDGRRVVFQLWDWAEDGRTYILHQFILRETDESWTTHHFSTSYRALLRKELANVMCDVGFTNLGWKEIGETGYHQPILVGRR